MFASLTPMVSLSRRRSFGSSRNLSSPTSLVGEERLRDEPKERLRERLTHGLFSIYCVILNFLFLVVGPLSSVPV